jgi:hypothetical protein
MHICSTPRIKALRIITSSNHVDCLKYILGRRSIFYDRYCLVKWLKYCISADMYELIGRDRSRIHACKTRGRILIDSYLLSNTSIQRYRTIPGYKFEAFGLPTEIRARNCLFIHMDSMPRIHHQNIDINEGRNLSLLSHHLNNIFLIQHKEIEIANVL